MRMTLKEVMVTIAKMGRVMASVHKMGGKLKAPAPYHKNRYGGWYEFEADPERVSVSVIRWYPERDQLVGVTETGAEAYCVRREKSRDYAFQYSTRSEDTCYVLLENITSDEVRRLENAAFRVGSCVDFVSADPSACRAVGVVRAAVAQNMQLLRELLADYELLLPREAC